MTDEMESVYENDYSEQNWTFEITVPRSEMLDALYNAANDWCERNLASMVNTPGATQEQLIRNARTADTTLYQIRQACASALGVIASMSNGDHVLSVSLRGRTSFEHSGTNDFVTIVVQHCEEDED